MRSDATRSSNGEVHSTARRGCRACGAMEVARELHLRERLLGLDQSFSYWQCARCECLQIERVPEDLGRYYSGGYYSFSSGLVARLLELRNDAALGRGNPLGRLLNHLYPNQALHSMRQLDEPLDSRILDVGCGSGAELGALARAGYRNLEGIDPFLPADVTLPAGPTLRARDLEQVTGEFDLVMFHHSLEHVGEPLRQLESTRRLLSTRGRCLIRIPVLSGEAWTRYRENWIQLDPPRHLFIPTPVTMRTLAAGAGLEVVDSYCDSTGFQFWASELVRRGIPLQGPGTVVRNTLRLLLHPLRTRRDRLEAQRLNRSGLGDQMVFLLRKSDVG